MCYLQETTFNCGHVQKSHFMACKFAERLTRTADGDVPKFCLYGFKVVKRIAVEEACGSSGGKICDRLQRKVLKRLQERQIVVEDEIASYAKRICIVKACLENGKRLLYNFQQVAEEGWNAKQEQKRQDTIWNTLLPTTMERTITSFADGCNEVTTAYTLTVNELLKRRCGMPLEGFKSPTLKVLLDLDWSIVDFLHKESLRLDEECAMFEQVFHKIRATLQHELLKLEIQALEACMDDVGWTLPKTRRNENLGAHDAISAGSTRRKVWHSRPKGFHVPRSSQQLLIGS